MDNEFLIRCYAPTNSKLKLPRVFFAKKQGENLVSKPKICDANSLVCGTFSMPILNVHQQLKYILIHVKFSLSIFQRNVFALGTNIFVCRTIDSSARHHFLDAVRAPAGNSRNGKKRRVKLARNVEHRIDEA